MSVSRREVLKTWVALAGGALAASSGVLAACRSAAPRSGTVLDHDDQDLIEEIADTLLPTTASSPGAKAAQVGPVINVILTDCYEPADQRRVVAGLGAFRALCRRRAGGEFATLPRADRERVLREVDAEARKAGESHYYPLVRDLAQSAYFSSEIGMTQALRYIRVPGRWEGCVPLVPGQPAWG